MLALYLLLIFLKVQNINKENIGHLKEETKFKAQSSIRFSTYEDFKLTTYVNFFIFGLFKLTFFKNLKKFKWKRRLWKILLVLTVKFNIFFLLGWMKTWRTETIGRVKWFQHLASCFLSDSIICHIEKNRNVFFKRMHKHYFNIAFHNQWKKCFRGWNKFTAGSPRRNRSDAESRKFRKRKCVTGQWSRKCVSRRCWGRSPLRLVWQVRARSWVPGQCSHSQLCLRRKSG